MKFSIKHLGLLVALVVIGIVLFTPLGVRLRRYVGVFRSEIKIALKTGDKISPNSYDWQLIDSNGNPHDFRNERGAVVFLNFWATWCAPCIKEIPDIEKLYDDYGDKITFLLVTQENPNLVNDFLMKKNYDLPIYYTKSDIPEALFSKTVPTTYIIDKGGKIILAETGAENWNSSEVRFLLDKLSIQK